MEKNTVVLSLEQYNVMRDKLKEVEKEHTFYVRENSYGCIITLISPEEAIENLVKTNNQLDEQLKKTASRANMAEAREGRDVNELKDKLKKMSWREFRRWKKQQ